MNNDIVMNIPKKIKVIPNKSYPGMYKNGYLKVALNRKLIEKRSKSIDNTFDDVDNNEDIKNMKSKLENIGVKWN